MQFLAEPAAAVLYSFFRKGESPEAKLTVVDNKRSEDFHILARESGSRLFSQHQQHLSSKLVFKLLETKNPLVVVMTPVERWKPREGVAPTGFTVRRARCHVCGNRGKSPRLPPPRRYRLDIFGHVHIPSAPFTPLLHSIISSAVR